MEIAGTAAVTQQHLVLNFPSTLGHFYFVIFHRIFHETFDGTKYPT